MYIINKLLAPMFQILNAKNVLGVEVLSHEDKIYITFEQAMLSITNRKIMLNISAIYSNIFFFSDNLKEPYNDCFMNWCPDQWYDEEYHITETCHKKRLVVLALEINDLFRILGITIILANMLQEQDILTLEKNKDKVVFSEDEIKRHDHYIENGSPDLGWISLNIILNKENPLNENDYAPSICLCELNSPVNCDHPLIGVLLGCENKVVLLFKLSDEELKKAIKDYCMNYNDENTNLLVKNLLDNPRRLLQANKES